MRKPGKLADRRWYVITGKIMSNANQYVIKISKFGIRVKAFGKFLSILYIFIHIICIIFWELMDGCLIS